MLEGIPCLQLFGCMKEERSRNANAVLCNGENCRARSEQGKSSGQSTVGLIADMLNDEGKFCPGSAVWVQRPQVLG